MLRQQPMWLFVILLVVVALTVAYAGFLPDGAGRKPGNSPEEDRVAPQPSILSAEKVPAADQQRQLPSSSRATDLGIRVRDSKGDPISIAVVSIRRLAGASEWLRLAMAGAGEFVLPPETSTWSGPVEIRVSAQGFLPYWGQHQLPNASSAEPTIDVVLRAPARLDVTVRLADGRPAAGVDVRVIPQSSSTGSTEVSVDAWEVASHRLVTDSAGRASVQRLLPLEDYVVAHFGVDSSYPQKKPPLATHRMHMLEGENSIAFRLDAVRIVGHYRPAIESSRAVATLLRTDGQYIGTGSAVTSLSGVSLHRIASQELSTPDLGFSLVVDRPGRYLVQLHASARDNIVVANRFVVVDDLVQDVDLGTILPIRERSLQFRVDIVGSSGRPTDERAMEDSRVTVNLSTGLPEERSEDVDAFLVGFSLEVVPGRTTRVDGLPNAVAFLRTVNTHGPAFAGKRLRTRSPSCESPVDDTGIARLVFQVEEECRVDFVVDGIASRPADLRARLLPLSSDSVSSEVPSEAFRWDPEHQTLSATWIGSPGEYDLMVRWQLEGIPHSWQTAMQRCVVGVGTSAVHLRPQRGSTVEFTLADFPDDPKTVVLNFAFDQSGNPLGNLMAWSDGVFRLEGVPAECRVWIFGIPAGASIQTADDRVVHR